MKNNCVYFHINPIKHEIFYVGIGDSERPYSKHGRNKWWHKIVNKYDYQVIIIRDKLSWDEACRLEVKYIKQIGRRDRKLGSLVNHTDGGNGSTGKIFTKEYRAKLSKPKSKNHKANISKSLLEYNKSGLRKLLSPEEKKRRRKLYCDTIRKQRRLQRRLNKSRP